MLEIFLHKKVICDQYDEVVGWFGWGNAIYMLLIMVVN